MRASHNKTHSQEYKDTHTFYFFKHPTAKFINFPHLQVPAHRYSHQVPQSRHKTKVVGQRARPPKYNTFNKSSVQLNDTLCHHCFCNLHESCHISTLHIVYSTVFLNTILHALFMNILHDALKFSINFFGTPRNLF